MEIYTISTQLPPYLPYPKYLLDIPVSETAKLVYILILGRIRLSQNNGWIDADGNVFCRYPIQSIVADSRKSKSTVVAALADLEKQDLIVRHREGLGYANKLYIKVPGSCTTVCRETVPQHPKKPAPNKNKQNIPNYEYLGDSL